jgi:hypothetical protein
MQPVMQPAFTSGMMAGGLAAQQQQMLQLQRLQQQQQQQQGRMPVVLLDTLSPTQQAQLQMMQQQQPRLACISPQLMPVQVSARQGCIFLIVTRTSIVDSNQFSSKRCWVHDCFCAASAELWHTLQKRLTTCASCPSPAYAADHG